MTLPMVTCPLCCRPGFNTSESLCSALISVTTRKLCCPLCNHVVVGLDKFTIHLFSHSLSKCSIERDSVQICESDHKDIDNHKTVLPANVSQRLDLINSSYSDNGFDEFHNNDGESNSKISEKFGWQLNSGNFPVCELPKTLLMPDTSVISVHADNGQIVSISADSLGMTLKNVMINTQNFITNTNFTTSTVGMSLNENLYKRKYTQVDERDSLVIINKVDNQGSPDSCSNVESVNSGPSTPSISSETDKQTSSCISEREFESCKDLLTKGDFSTIIDEVNDNEMKKKLILANENSIDGSIENKDDPFMKGNLNCELCPYVFSNKTILAMHKQLIHKKVEMDVENKRKTLICNQCPRTFSLRSSLMIHRRVAHAGGFGSSDNGNVQRQPPSKPACHVCGKFFKKEIHLAQHMKAHDEKQWQCTICSKTFTTKYFLKKHRRLHTGETPYKCTTCSKSFTFQQSYHKHLLYHNDEKPYCCAQCGRLFKELSTLHNHERIHSGEKPFCCETCGKSFRQRVSYLVHRRIHTGAMPYQCTACNKSFRYKISQRTHKCSINPPGVVVRTNGSLVERLQAAMNKASVESDQHSTANNVESDTLTFKDSSKLLESKNSLKLPTESTSFSMGLSDNEVNSSSLCSSSIVIPCSENNVIEKKRIEKPQIYLLVKGPNEEACYQPLLISQNNEIICNENKIPNKKNNIKESKIQNNSLTTEKQTKVEKYNNHVSNYLEQSLDGNESSDFNGFVLENEKKHIEKTCEQNGNCQLTKSSFSFASDVKKSNDCDSIDQVNVYNILSDDSALNDFVTNLNDTLLDIKNNSEMNEVQEVSNCNKENINNNVVIADSTDLLSLVSSSSLSSSSECFGNLSLFSNSTIQQNNGSNNLYASNIFKDNVSGTNDELHESLFDNISDDALKELLFGSSK